MYLFFVDVHHPKYCMTMLCPYVFTHPQAGNVMTIHRHHGRSHVFAQAAAAGRSVGENQSAPISEVQFTSSGWPAVDSWTDEQNSTQFPQTSQVSSSSPQRLGKTICSYATPGVKLKSVGKPSGFSSFTKPMVTGNLNPLPAAPKAHKAWPKTKNLNRLVQPT